MLGYHRVSSQPCSDHNGLRPKSHCSEYAPRCFSNIIAHQSDPWYGAHGKLHLQQVYRQRPIISLGTNSPFQQTPRKGGQIDQGRMDVYPVSQNSLLHAVAE